MAISYAFSSAQKFPHYFTVWISRASPRNSCQMRRNSNFYLFFSHPSATSVLSSRKAQNLFSWEAASISDLPESVLPAGGCAGSEHPGRRAPHSAAPRSSGGASPVQPCPGWCLIETPRLCNCRWRTREGKSPSDTEQSRAPCKQCWGEVAKMHPFQPEHYESQSSNKYKFAAISLNNLRTAVIAYVHTVEETTVF